MTNKTTVLVTGATGFIGSHVADLLLKKNYNVKCIYKSSSNKRWLNNKPFKTFELRLDDVDSLKEILYDVDYIYHVGGLITASSFDKYLIANRDSTKNLLEATLKYAPNIKRFLHISSQTVMGPAVSIDKPFHEYDECKPITSYAKSKLAGEMEVRKYFDKFPITIIRPPAVYGPRDTGIYSMFKSAKKGLFPIVGFKSKYLSLIHCYDLARGIVEAAESNNTIGKTYFLTSDIFYTWEDIIDELKKVFNNRINITIRIPHFLVLMIAGFNELIGKFSKKPPVFNYEKGVDFIQPYWICSAENAKKDFGFKTEIDLETGIKNTFDWYKENNWL